MTRHFTVVHVCWRDAAERPWGLLANDRTYGRAAADALADKLNALSGEGWIIDRILPGGGITPAQTASYTVVAFK